MEQSKITIMGCEQDTFPKVLKGSDIPIRMAFMGRPRPEQMSTLWLRTYDSIVSVANPRQTYGREHPGFIIDMIVDLEIHVKPHRGDVNETDLVNI